MELIVIFTTRLLYPQGIKSPVPMDRRLGVLQSRSGLCGGEKNPLPLPGIDLLRCSNFVKGISVCLVSEWFLRPVMHYE
jgi:hypothetical protein